MAEVCVIGAGPAGSIFAARMAQLGHQVDLIERQRFPRSHLGESLSPGVMPLLQAAGMRETIEAAGFPSVTGVWVNWAQQPRLRQDPGERGLLVDRGEFDRRLLARARAFGVRVHQPARVLERTRDDAKWHLAIEADGAFVRLDADFVADASGRRGISRQRRIRKGAATLAVYGYWRGKSQPTVPRIEAGHNAWYWGVPLPDGSYNTLIFVDPDRFRSAPGTTMSERFLRLLDRSTLMNDCRDAELITAVRAIDATPYLSGDCVAPDRIELGDAALAIDPISSSGVQKAIQTALSGAIVANTLLRRPESTDAALSFYRAQLGEASERHRRWAAEHYRDVAERCAGPFWQQRAGPQAVTDPAPLPAIDARGFATTPVELSPELEFAPTPCLQGDFVSLAPALHHPRLASPIAFLGGRELAPLLRILQPGRTPLQIAQSWSNRMPLQSGLAIAGWLVNHGILVEQRGRSGMPS
ncbi:MAG: tryptophan 7-halogenase [Bradyrhizobium sp.]|uniref:flavin-dependent monooxygenase QhpG n=1 Tax=Bradyrhizobium sp. TaxID=376 RepID=UPI00238AFA0C|nr:NAD(P)/FAD-dependent oxidoreductase [Bradyrhizobium sp.]MDE2600918.1 tryptophan 7-halogenase [Bradyrhizobium sp.]